MAKSAFDVTIFEAFHNPDGIFMCGIREFHLPKALAKKISGHNEHYSRLVITVIKTMEADKKLRNAWQNILKENNR